MKFIEMLKEGLKEKWVKWAMISGFFIVYIVWAGSLRPDVISSEHKDTFSDHVIEHKIDSEEEATAPVTEKRDIEKETKNKIDKALKETEGTFKIQNIEYGTCVNDDAKVIENKMRVSITAKNQEFDKNDCLYNTLDVGERLSKLSEVESLQIDWEADAVDDYGNTKQSKICTISFNSKAFRKINWEMVSPNDLPKVADYYWERPQFR